MLFQTSCTVGVVVHRETVGQPVGDGGYLLRIAKLGIVEAEGSRIARVSDLDERAKIGGDPSRVEETRLLREEQLAVLRVVAGDCVGIRQCRLGLGIRSLKHEGQRRHLIQEQLVILVLGNPLHLREVVDLVGVQLELAAERRELGENGVAALAGDACLAGVRGYRAGGAAQAQADYHDAHHPS